MRISKQVLTVELERTLFPGYYWIRRLPAAEPEIVLFGSPDGHWASGVKWWTFGTPTMPAYGEWIISGPVIYAE